MLPLLKSSFVPHETCLYSLSTYDSWVVVTSTSIGPVPPITEDLVSCVKNIITLISSVVHFRAISEHYSKANFRVMGLLAKI